MRARSCCLLLYVMVLGGTGPLLSSTTLAAAPDEIVGRIRDSIGTSLAQMRESSGVVTVTYSYPRLDEDKGKTLHSLFGYHGDREYSAQIPDVDVDDVLDATLVAVTSPMISFVLVKGAKSQFLVEDVRGGEEGRSELLPAVDANTGFLVARYRSAFIDLSEHLGASGWKTLAADLTDDSQARVRFSSIVDGSTRTGSFVYDLNVHGLRELVVNHGSLQESVRVEYESPGTTGAAFPSRVVHELRESGALTQITESVLHSWVPEPPAEEVFDIRYYGVEGASEPRTTLLPRWLTLALIIAAVVATVVVIRRKGVR